MDEDRTQTPNEQDEQEAPAEVIAGQISFFNDAAEAEQGEHENEHTEAPELYFTKNKDGAEILTDKDGNDITDDPAARTKLAAYIGQNLTPAILKAIIKTSKSIDELASIYNVFKDHSKDAPKPDSEAPDIAGDFLKLLTKDAAEAVKAAAEKQKQNAINAGKLQQRAESVKSYIIKELQKKRYHGATLDSLLYDRDPAALADPDDKKTTLLLKALAAAEAAAQAIKAPDTIATPLDKLNNGIWNLAAGKSNKLNLTINTTPHIPNAAETSVKGILYFDEDIEKKYHLSKKLTPFDKLTASAIFSIWRDNHDSAGHCVTTLTAIYKSINKGKPSTAQLKKYRDSIIKQTLTRLTVDNEEEAKLYNYDHFYIGDAALLEARDIQEVDRNGKITESAILILAAPPAIAFSLAHGRELADIPAEVFKSGISQTDSNLKIQDYLLRRIAPAKRNLRKLIDGQKKTYTQERQHKINNSREIKILTKTFYQNAEQDADRQTKRRALVTAMKYLNHYKSEAGGAWIEDAKITKDREKIIIKLPTK